MRALRLRPAAEADAALLREIFGAARRPMFEPLGLPAAQLEQLLGQQFAAQTRQYRAQYPAAQDCIVCREGVDIGRLYLHRGADEIRIVDIALLPRHRGGGSGARLIGQLQEEAKQRGLPLRLSVAQGNPAMALYRRLGFAVTAADATDVSMEWRAPLSPSA
jgi:ribosomal protein S18 acetylase RimI-like enzyme